MLKNKVIIEIMDSEYAILSEDRPEYVLETAAAVEKKIKNIINNNQKVSLIMASNLACMDFYDEARKAKADAENLRLQIKDYADEVNKLKIKLDSAKLEIDELNKEKEKEVTSHKSSFDVIRGNKRNTNKTPKNDESTASRVGFFDTKKQ